MTLNPLNRPRQHRQPVHATVVAYVGWRKVAGRDAYRIWAPADVASATPAGEAHQAAPPGKERAAKVYPRLGRRVRRLPTTARLAT